MITLDECTIQPQGYDEAPDKRAAWVRVAKITRRNKPVAILMLETGRIECEICRVTIGQGNNNHTGDVGFMEVDHCAPCGLPCACEGSQALQALNSTAGGYGAWRDKQIHASKNHCPRCAPRTCPACLGKGLARHTSNPKPNFPGAQCVRCSGLGSISGADGWDGV